MVKICANKGCKSQSYLNCGVSFFQFPSDLIKKINWIKAIANADKYKFKKHSVICSNHFNPKQIITHTTKASLPPDAPPQQPRLKPPKDGPGPRGVPEVYYTSRTLNSTFRYVKFVKKLRADEEEQRKGAENKLKALKDLQNQDFFIRCDRRSLINNVARRVNLCMASYEADLMKKRERLMNLLQLEEEANIRKFVEEAQAGAELIWQDKQNRLKYLLDKRRKEHEEKYKDTPLSKCAHILPCIFKIRAKETQEFQLYQMKEKEARKMAEKEFDKMWHEVAMKESEALAARMELDAIERARQNLSCKLHSDFQLEQRRIQKEKDRQRLIEETKMFQSIWEEDNMKEEEAEAKRQEKRLETARERQQMIEERAAMVAKQTAENKLIDATWDSLAGQGLADEKAKIELARQKERDLDECNRKMIQLKHEILAMESENDELFRAEAKKLQDVVDKRRCEYLLRSRKNNKDCRNSMMEQIKERQEARDKLKEKLAEQGEYQRQLEKQLNELSKYRDMKDAEIKKIYQKQLLEQIDYNKLLKEREREEVTDQIRKCQLETDKYQEQITEMLKRPFFSEEIHPFMKKMYPSIEMKDRCPCSKPDYCKKPGE